MAALTDFRATTVLVKVRAAAAPYADELASRKLRSPRPLDGDLLCRHHSAKFWEAHPSVRFKASMKDLPS